MSGAICDVSSFYAFRALVEGHLDQPEYLEQAERFVRSVVMHDNLEMIVRPLSHPGLEDDWTDEELACGGRSVIVAISPIIDYYADAGLLSHMGYEEERRRGDSVEIPEPIWPMLVDAANCDSGPYLDAHVSFVKCMLGTLRHDGSIICEELFCRKVTDLLSSASYDLFASLDPAWKQLAQRFASGKIGLVVPPFLSILLSRCAPGRRDAIPRVLADMKAEFAVSRYKVWRSLSRLKLADTIEDLRDVQEELEKASKAMVPDSAFQTLQPARFFWNFAKSAFTPNVFHFKSLEDGFSSLSFAALRAIGESALEVQDFRLFLRRGAFDLARRVRTELRTAPLKDLLRPLLSADELSALGL